MSATKIPDVLPAKEAREALSAALRRFRNEGIHAEPLIFGVHRKPEAAVIPYELYQLIEDIVDDLAIMEEIRPRLDRKAEDIGMNELLDKAGIDPSLFDE